MRVCVLLCLVLPVGCMHTPYEYATDNYVVVKTRVSDTLASLAGKYLNDPEKAWVIADFNKIDETFPGRVVIIPLHPFNMGGGMGQGGYQLVPVLCYENVTHPGKILSVVPQLKFEQQMAYLKKNDFQVIPLSSLLDFLDEKGQILEKSIVITFDDNTKDVISVAVPVLEKYGYPATVFVDPDLLGKPGYLTEDDVASLRDRGWDIQCRAGWGIDADIELQKITLVQYFQSLIQNIPRAKASLEKLTGKTCSIYAFPPGGENNLIVRVLQAAGFKAALRMNGMSNPFYVNHFSVGRVPVPPACSASEFASKLTVFKKLDLN